MYKIKNGPLTAKMLQHEMLKQCCGSGLDRIQIGALGDIKKKKLKKFCHPIEKIFSSL
jgi:hypothetical protein